MVDNGHIKFLEQIARRDVETLKRKDSEYGASWKKRGGTGAFMMLARKWDRLENGLAPLVEGSVDARLGKAIGQTIPVYDIIVAALIDDRQEGILDDIRDLRAYLLLVEAEVMNQQDKHRAAEGDFTEIGDDARG